MKKPAIYRKSQGISHLRCSAANWPMASNRFLKWADHFARREEPKDYWTRIVWLAAQDLLRPTTDYGSKKFNLSDLASAEMAAIENHEIARYLFYRYRYEMYPAQRVVDDFPPCLQIEPSSICNYRCIFCYQTDRGFTRTANGHMGFMSLNLFRRLVDQAEGSCDVITLASRGEPLMCPDIEAMLRYIGGKFLASKINTNAWFLDEAKARAILEAGVRTVVFSVDAVDETTYSRLRRRGDLKRVRSNIVRFHEIRERDYPDSVTITRVSGVNVLPKQNIEVMGNYWLRFVDQVAFVEYNPWENTYANEPNTISEPCSDLWRRMFVWHDGTVNPCDVDYRSTLRTGDATTESISEIWNGQAYTNLRTAHLSGRRGTCDPCRRCVFL